MKRSGTVMERSGTVRNGHANVHANGQERWTLNGQERLGTFESEHKNALERIVDKVHCTFTFTFQKRKKHCKLFQLKLGS
jgi:hypothetical protein